MTESLGSAAEEAAKLLAVVQEWARTRLDGEHLATDASECQICPVCQAIAAVRQIKPEAVQHLLDAAASVVAALKSTVSPAPAPHPGPPRVQHIDVRDG